MIVLRRFPTYDFMFYTELPPSAAADRLEVFLRDQAAPRGFVLTDPRFDGHVDGSTFWLRRFRSGSNMPIPRIEGFFVPEGSGTNVFVQVGAPGYVLLATPLAFVPAIAVMILNPAEAAVLLPLLVILPIIFTVALAHEAGNARETIQRAFVP